MRHIDGISVTIAQPYGSRYTEYHNPYVKRHPSFHGSLGSRLVLAAPGSAFTIDVEFDVSFKVYRATGVAIIIVIGDKSSQLIRDDNAQVFWLDASQMNIRQKHRFSTFAMWENEGTTAPSRHIPLEMPRPNAEYMSATADWLACPEMHEANTGCIEVWVMRAKTNDKDFDPPPGEKPCPTDPPRELRTIDSGWPKVVYGRWFEHLKSLNGLEYGFEFINMELGTIDQTQNEADPEFGHDDKLWRELLDDGDEFNEEGSNPRRDPWGDDEEYCDEADFEAYEASRNKRTYTDRRRSRHFDRPRKRSRMGNPISDPASTTEPAAGVEPGTAQTTGQVCSTEDDEEPLPIRRKEEVKEEETFDREPSRTQEPTPPPDQQQARETTADLYGMTPERRIPDIYLTVDDEEQLDVKQEPAPETTHPADNGEADLEEDLEYRSERAEIERDHRLELAKIRAEQRARERRRQLQGESGSETPAQHA